VAPVRDAEFARLVEDALAAIPEEFTARLENVAVVIEDEPSPALLRDLGMDPADTLYGLYEGTPLTERAHDFAALPDRITLFRGPLCRDFPRPARLRREIARTLVHEIAHFFGLDDDRVRDLGY
jgi:predicted Zn-dependent protease with MMP-like domain